MCWIVRSGHLRNGKNKLVYDPNWSNTGSVMILDQLNSNVYLFNLTNCKPTAQSFLMAIVLVIK